MSTEPDDRVLMAYLLGEVSEETRAELEQAYLSDPPVFDRLLSLESDLLDQYASGELSVAHRAVVESRLQASADLRERLAFARSLRRLANEPQPKISPSAARLRWFPALGARHLGWAASLLLVAAWAGHQVGVFAPRSPRDAGPSPTAGATGPSQIETVVVKPTGGPTLPPSRDWPVVDVYPGTLRDETGPAAVSISPGQTRIDLVAHLDEAPPAGTRNVVLTLQKPDGDEVWRHTCGAPRRTPAGWSLPVSIPTSVLPSGDYILTATGLTASEPSPVIAYYTFRIRRSNH